MAVFKCKMCGGQLDINDETVVECEYCGTKQTVPTLDNDKKINLFTRANRLRINNEFDKAISVFESIVAEFPEEAEAYWGLVLCKYGIEYVDDPATGKKIPTCHRTSFDSVMKDSNFEMVLEYADSVARRVYRDEAKIFEEIRKGIIEVSSKEEPYDIFICYKETDENGERTLDSVLAQDIYTELTDKGYKVFFARITLEDKLGQEYEPYIFSALNSSKVMLVVGTDYEYFNAVWVKNEWSRFLKLISNGQKKSLIPCYKNIDAYDMPDEFAKLQAQDLGKVGATQDLLRGIEKIIPLKKEEKQSTTIIQMNNVSASIEPLFKRAMIYLEDKDWGNAIQYFDKVLDMNPEYSEAYAGKFLAKYKILPDQFVNNINSKIQNVNTTSLTINCKKDHIDEMVSKYRIEKYLDKLRIEKMYDFNLNYPIKSEQFANLQNEVEAMFNDNDYKKVEKYNQGTLSLSLVQGKQEILDLFIREKDKIKKYDEDNKIKKIKEYNEFILKTDQKLNELHFDKLKQKEKEEQADNDRKNYALDPKVRRKYSLVDNMICFQDHIFAALDENGKLYIHDPRCLLENMVWKDEFNKFIGLTVRHGSVVSIKPDGTVAQLGKFDANIVDWTDIKQLVFFDDVMLGLKNDGTLKSNVFEYRKYIDDQAQVKKILYSSGDFGEPASFVTEDNTIYQVTENSFYRYNFKNKENIIDVTYVGKENYAVTYDNGKIEFFNPVDIDISKINNNGGVVLFKLIDGSPIAITCENKLIYGRSRLGIESNKYNELIRHFDIKEVVGVCGDWKRHYVVSKEGIVYHQNAATNTFEILFGGKKLFSDFDKILEKCIFSEENLEKEKLRKEALMTSRKEQGLCQHCGGTFKKSLFGTKCTSCGKSKDY